MPLPILPYFTRKGRPILTSSGQSFKRAFGTPSSYLFLRDTLSDLTPQPDTNPLPTILAYLFVISVLLITIPFIVYSVCFRWKNCCGFLQNRKTTTRKRMMEKRDKLRDEEEGLEAGFVDSSAGKCRFTRNANTSMNGPGHIFGEDERDTVDLEANVDIPMTKIPIATRKKAAGSPGGNWEVLEKERERKETSKATGKQEKRKWYEPKNVLRKRSTWSQYSVTFGAHGRRNMTCPLPKTSTAPTELWFQGSLSLGSDDSFEGAYNIQQQHWWRKLFSIRRKSIHTNFEVMPQNYVCIESTLTPPPRVPYPSISYPFPVSRAGPKTKHKPSIYMMRGARDDLSLPLPELGNPVATWTSSQRRQDVKSHIESFSSLDDNSFGIYSGHEKQKTTLTPVLLHYDGHSPYLATTSFLTDTERQVDGPTKGTIGEGSQNGKWDKRNGQKKCYTPENNEEQEGKATEDGTSFAVASSSRLKNGSIEGSGIRQERSREVESGVCNGTRSRYNSFDGEVASFSMKQIAIPDASRLGPFEIQSKRPLLMNCKNKRIGETLVDGFVNTPCLVSSKDPRGDRIILSRLLPPFTRFLYSKWRKHNVEIQHLEDPLGDRELRRVMSDNARARRDRLLRLRTRRSSVTGNEDNVREMSLLIKRRFSEPSCGLKKWAETVWREALEEVSRANNESRGETGLGLPFQQSVAYPPNRHLGSHSCYLPSSLPSWFTFESCSNSNSENECSSFVKTPDGSGLGSVIEASDEDIRVVLKRVVRARRAQMKEVLRALSERRFLEELDKRLEWWWGETNPSVLEMGCEVGDGLRGVEAYVLKRIPGEGRGITSFAEPITRKALKLHTKVKQEDILSRERKKMLSMTDVRAIDSASPDNSIYACTIIQPTESRRWSKVCSNRNSNSPELSGKQELFCRRSISSTALPSNEECPPQKRRVLLNTLSLCPPISPPTLTTNGVKILKIRTRKSLSLSSPLVSNNKNLTALPPLSPKRLRQLRECGVSAFMNLELNANNRISEASGYLADDSELDSTVRMELSSISANLEEGNEGEFVDTVMNTCSTGTYEALVMYGANVYEKQEEPANNDNDDNSSFREANEWLAGLGLVCDSHEYSQGISSRATTIRSRKAEGNFRPNEASLSSLSNLILTTTTETNALSLLSKRLEKKKTHPSYFTKEMTQFMEFDDDGGAAKNEEFSPITSMRLFNIGTSMGDGDTQITNMEDVAKGENYAQPRIQLEKVEIKRAKVKIVGVTVSYESMRPEMKVENQTGNRDGKKFVLHKRAFSEPPMYHFGPGSFGCDATSEDAWIFGKSHPGNTRGVTIKPMVGGKCVKEMERGRRIRSEYWDRSIKMEVKRIFGMGLTSEEGDGDMRK